MRTSTAYFAGVGTVIAAVSAGLGGGYLAANVTHPPTQAVSKLERRMSAEPIAVSTAPAEPVPQVAGAAPTKPAAAPAQEQTQQQPETQQQPNTQQQPQPQIEAAAPAANPARAEEKPAHNVAVVQPPPQPSKPADQADEKTAGPREVYARASDADVKRADAEKRRAERRQQWTDKRRLKQPREQDLSNQPREPELDAVEARVREVTEPRRIRIREEGEPRGLFAEPRRREMFAEPVRSETPRIRLFDQD
jgi:xanthosine utilization system XapX-like protein